VNKNICLKNRVKEFRFKSNLTQEQLAKKVGISRQSIISIEKSDCTPSVLIALKISEVLNKKFSDVFFAE